MAPGAGYLHGYFTAQPLSRKYVWQAFSGAKKRENTDMDASAFADTILILSN